MESGREPNPYELLDVRLRRIGAWWGRKDGTQKIDVIRVLVEGSTLVAAAFAGIFAFQTWDATRQANEISERTYKTSQRAYLTVTGLDIQESNEGDDLNPRLRPFLRVVPIVVNSGNTPTKHLWWSSVASDACGKLWWRNETVSCNDEPKIQTVNDLRGVTHNRLLIGPRQELRPLGWTQIIPAPMKTDILAGNTTAYIHGSLLYRDTLSAEIHATRYCFMLWHNGTITKDVTFSSCVNHPSCTDDECEDYEQLKTLPVP